MIFLARQFKNWSLALKSLIIVHKSGNKSSNYQQYSKDLFN